MTKKSPLDASDPASFTVYEFSGRRYVVTTAFQEDNGSPLSELLLRIIVNDGKTLSEIRDADFRT